MELATMEDFQEAESDSWETGAENDAHLMVRETAPWKVRERWAETRLIEHRMMLERELACAHITEHMDSTLEPLPMLPSKPRSWWQEAREKLAIYLCRFMHAAPTYRRVDQFSECPACKRKYALPFADWTKLPSDVYVPTKPFVAPTEAISQVKCKNGWMGVV